MESLYTNSIYIYVIGPGENALPSTMPRVVLYSKGFRISLFASLQPNLKLSSLSAIAELIRLSKFDVGAVNLSWALFCCMLN